MISDLIHRIKSAGLEIAVIAGSSLMVTPKDKIPADIRQAIKAHKQPLLAFLKHGSPQPMCCARCNRVEHISENERSVAGCSGLYPPEGFTSHWRRIPEGLKECLRTETLPAFCNVECPNLQTFNEQGWPIVHWCSMDNSVTRLDTMAECPKN